MLKKNQLTQAGIEPATFEEGSKRKYSHTQNSLKQKKINIAVFVALLLYQNHWSCNDVLALLTRT